MSDITNPYIAFAAFAGVQNDKAAIMTNTTLSDKTPSADILGYWSGDADYVNNCTEFPIITSTLLPSEKQI